MGYLTMCFRMHQPFWLHPEGTEFLWEEKCRSVFETAAQTLYLPALRTFARLVTEYPHFKVTLSFSGTFLEQAERYCPDILAVLRELAGAGRSASQVDFVEETYYHSLASLFADPQKAEFHEQVSLHRKKTSELLEIQPAVFADTDLIYSRETADIVADMGFRTMLCDPPAPGELPNAVFRAVGRNGRIRDMAVLPRNASLSRYTWPQLHSGGLSPEQFVGIVRQQSGDTTLLVYNVEALNDSLVWDGAANFLQSLAGCLKDRPEVTLATASQAAERFLSDSSPLADWPEHGDPVAGLVPESQEPALALSTQRLLFRDIQSIEQDARRAGGDLLRRFRYLTSCDHLRYLSTGSNGRADSEYLSPYDSVAAAAYAVTQATNELSHSIWSFNILKERTRTPVIIVTPETARLPSTGMGQFAKYVSGKSGGLGEVASALCQGLSERGVPVHMITINLSRRFREESGLSESEWIQKRHQLDPQNIHLVTSSIFEGYRSAYDGSPLANAAEFQRQMVNTYIREIRSEYEGRAILHTHDWMAGGVVVPYARLRGVPVLHTVHNTHTGLIPLEMYYGVNLRRMWNELCIASDRQNSFIDSHATAIRNATRISSVGEKFLYEVVSDFFLDRTIVPPSVREEIKLKHRNNAAVVIPNGISPDVFPECQAENLELDRPGLARRFGPEDNLIEAKRLNLMKFQKRVGLVANPEAILLYWPSRLDPVQKGIELLEHIAEHFVGLHPDVQIAVIGDPVGGDNTHAEIMGRISCASRGRIAYHRFDQNLSILGYAAASDVFGASLYEPFGQIDVVGNLYGATATNRDTGGYSDKISMLRLRAWGAPIDRGNGVLFRDYNAEGLWWGLDTTVQNHRYFRQNPDEWQRQMRRIMLQARNDWSLDNMVARYITAYEELNGDKPLA